MFQKTGKWNAMHVRIAWEIYNHQQKAKSENKNGPPTSNSLKPHGFELLNKPQGPPGPDYMGKRPGPPQDLMGRTPSLYGGAMGLPTPPYDLLGRSPYAAPSRYYGAAPLGKHFPSNTRKKKTSRILLSLYLC